MKRTGFKTLFTLALVVVLTCLVLPGDARADDVHTDASGFTIRVSDFTVTDIWLDGNGNEFYGDTYPATELGNQSIVQGLEFTYDRDPKVRIGADGSLTLSYYLGFSALQERVISLPAAGFSCQSAMSAVTFNQSCEIRPGGVNRKILSWKITVSRAAGVGHVYSVNYTEATCVSPSSTLYTCISGDHSYTSTGTGPKPEAHSWSGWTSNGDGTHSRVCAYDAAHTERGNCSGGTAVCESPAVCTECGSGYGRAPGHTLVYAARGWYIMEECYSGGVLRHSANAVVEGNTYGLVYNGESHRPYTVKYGSGWCGEKNHSIEYKDNRNAGTATATVTIRGKSITLTFTIGKATPTAADFQLTLPGSAVYDGSTDHAAALQVNTSRDGMGGLTVKLYRNGQTVTEAVKPGTYTVKIDVQEGSNYKAVSGLTDSSWTFTVEQGEPDPAVPAGLTAQYGETLGDLDLSAYSSELGSWMLPGTEHQAVGNVGTNLFTMEFHPVDSGYKTVQREVPVTVSPKPVSIREVQSETREYDGSAAVTVSSVTLNGLLTGDDVAVDLAALQATLPGSDAGVYTEVALRGIALTGGAAGNYRLQPTNQTVAGHFEIKPLTVGAENEHLFTLEPEEGPFVYNGAAHEPGMAVRFKGELLESDQYALRWSENINAGTGKVHLETVSGSSFVFVNTYREFVIDPAPLTVAADYKDIKTGAKLPTLTYTVTGLVGSDTLLTEPVLALEKEVDTRVEGQTAILISGADAGSNYVITYANGVLTVKDPPILVEVDMSGIIMQDKVYDGQPLEWSGSASVEGRPQITFGYRWVDQYENIYKKPPTRVGTYTFFATVGTKGYKGFGTLTVNILPEGSVLPGTEIGDPAADPGQPTEPVEGPETPVMPEVVPETPAEAPEASVEIPADTAQTAGGGVSRFPWWILLIAAVLGGGGYGIYRKKRK